MANDKPSGLTRRSFLKATALSAGAAAAVGMAGCSTLAEQTEEAAQQAVEEKTYTNWCRGGCGRQCNLTGTVREGKLVKTMPTKVAEGAELMQLGCLRGISNVQKLYNPTRILYPMKQTGERGSDNWERISWDEAFELAANYFNKTIDEYGAESIGYDGGDGNVLGVVNGWGARYGSNDWGRAQFPQGIALDMFWRKTGFTEMLYSEDCTLSWMAFQHLQQPMATIEDISNSEAVILWSTNPAETFPSAWPYICAARERGAKIVAIDPRYSKSASGADIWVPIRQGTDAALALAMSNYIIDNDLIDYDYLRNKSVAPLLITEEGKYLRLSDLGMDPVEVVDPLTGEKNLRDTEVVWDEAAGAFGSSFEVKDPAITGTFDADGVSVRPVYEAVVEQIKPFTVEYAADECGLSIEQVEEVCELYATSKPAKILNQCGIEHMENTWRYYMNVAFLASVSGNACVPGGGYCLGLTQGSTIMKSPVNFNKAAATDIEVKNKKGITLEYLPQILETGKWAGEDFTIKGLFIVNDNPLTSRMGPTQMKEAFKKLDFIVCADPFMTYTAKYADLVLPISLSWEDEDHNTTISFHTQKAVEPMGESKSNFEMLKGIAEAMGITDLYTKTQQEYLREILDTPENIEAGVAYDDFAEKGVIYTEFQESEGTPAVETNPTGRTQFFVEELIPNNDYGQVFELSDRLPNYVQSIVAGKDNPQRDQYPLFALTAHSIYFGHTQTNNIPWLDEIRGYEGEPFITIHKKAAEERGIAMGDTIKAYNDFGSFTAKAVVSTGIREDTILLPRGYEFNQYIDGNPQDLTSIVLDPLCSNGNHNDIICQVEKL